MDQIIDFSKCKRAHAVYGGSDRKFGVVYNGSTYMLKFSDHHAKRSDVSTSYVNNVISEYISSHIANSVGLSTHETFLGFYYDELVVGCKDFRSGPSCNIIEFSEYLRARYSSKEMSRILRLDQIYESLQDPNNDIPVFLQRQAIDRYWDTFVIDALVGNFDRHSGNWGFLFQDNTLSLAPVYDFGSSLFPNLSDLGMEEMMNSNYEMIRRCLVFPSSSIALTREKIGKAGYYDLLSSNYDENCTAAVLRMFPKIDLDIIFQIIEDTPLISNIRKQFYKQILELRFELVLSRAYYRCLTRDFDGNAQQRLELGETVSDLELNRIVSGRNSAASIFKKNEETMKKFFAINSMESLHEGNCQNNNDGFWSIVSNQTELLKEYGFRSSIMPDIVRLIPQDSKQAFCKPDVFDLSL